MFKLKSFTLITLVAILLLFANAVSADTVTFGLTNFEISTTTTYNTPLNASTPSGPALPDDSTFTLEPNSTNLYLGYQVGKFARYDLVLPTGYDDLAFSFTASVNDAFVLYINGTIVAMQVNNLVANFQEPLPGFSMDSNGLAVKDVNNKLDYLLTSGMQALFQEGTNELTLFGRDIGNYGGFYSVSGAISYTVEQPPPPNGVPEPTTMLLLGLGLVGLAGVKRKFNK